MKKALLLMGVALLAFASCSQDEIKEVNRGNAIDFRMPSLTKATETTTYNLSEFYASAYVPGNFVTSYYSDVKYTKMVDHFVSTPEYLWPGDGSSLNFYAYSPSAEKVGTPEMTADGVYQLTYSPSQNISEQVDLITATATGSSADAATGVVLEFAHRLAQISVSAYNGDQNHVVKVKGVKIANVNDEATLNFSDGTWSYKDVPTYTTYSTTYDQERNISTWTSLMNSVSVDGISCNDNAMVIPQTLTAWDPANPNGGGSYIGVLINITTSEGAQVYPETPGEYAWVAKPISGEWVAGKRYNYNLDFTDGAGYEEGGDIVNDDIAFTLSVREWNEVDSQEEIYAGMVGTWKAYKFEHINYHDDEATKISSIGTIYADHETTTYYDEAGNKISYSYNTFDLEIDEDYVNGVLSYRSEEHPTYTLQIHYNEDGTEQSRNRIEETNSFVFEGTELTDIAGGGFAYFRIPEENSNLIIILNPADGSETGMSIAYTMENSYMIIPSLDGTRTVPHVDEIVYDPATGKKTAVLSIDRRGGFGGDNHLQYIYYDITPNI